MTVTRQEDSAVSSIAAAIGEPVRARMLFALLDDRARTSTELALIGSVSPSTASTHLARLRGERLVVMEVQGKHRYYRLNGEHVASVLESLAVLAGSPVSTFVSSTPPALREARSCYDHIAGALGVRLHDGFLARRWIAVSNDSRTVDVTSGGARAFAGMGIDVHALRRQRRRFAFACLDWSERRPHLGGALGAALLALALKRRWLRRERESRVLNVTPPGRLALSALLHACVWLMFVATGIPSVAQAQGSCNVPARDAIVNLPVPGSPFEPVISQDGCWLFVTLASPNGAGQVAVVRREGGSLSVVRTVPVKGNPAGAVLTHDGKTLVVADGAYIAFLDVNRLERGNADPVVGYMGGGSEVGFIYANVTADDKTVFVAAERAQSIIVLNLERIRAGQLGPEAAIGRLDVGGAPIAVTLSSDGRYLYTTSEVALPEWKWHEDCRPENAAAASGRGRGQALRYHALGAVMVFDAALAVTDPSHALVARVAAGCNPVRLVLSPDDATAYVSARGDDALLAFDAHRLVSDTAHALLGSAKVGDAPVGISVIDGGTRIVVTNSNRFAGGGRQPLAVLDAERMRAGGRKAVLGEIPAGGFPRELRLTADGRTMFVTNFSSGTVEMVDLARALPKAK